MEIVYEFRTYLHDFNHLKILTRNVNVMLSKNCYIKKNTINILNENWETSDHQHGNSS